MKVDTNNLLAAEIENNLANYFSEAIIKRMIKYYRDQHTNFKKKDALLEIDKVMHRNPYELVDVSYVSVSAIDKMVLELPDDHPWHVGLNSQRRIDAMMHAVLNAGLDHGQAVFAKQSVFQDTYSVLVQNTPNEQLDDDLKQAYVDGIENSEQYQRIKYHSGDFIMDRDYYTITIELAKRLHHLANRKRSDYDKTLLKTKFDAFAKTNGFSLDYQQQDTVVSLLENPVSLVTGFAGTGKTTLLEVVCKYIEAVNSRVTLCSTAARAVDNLKSVCHVDSYTADAKTVAGLIYAGQMINTEYLIIDEISMVSEANLRLLLNLTPNSTKVIMVGDREQLPAVKSVGVLTSLLNYVDEHPDFINYQNLIRVYRQAEANSLQKIAMQVREGDAPDLTKKFDKSVKVLSKLSFENYIKLYFKVVDHYGIDDVKVITLKRDDVKRSNLAIQNLIQPKNKPKFMTNGRRFCVGDRVLVTKNMKDLMDYNDSAARHAGVLINGSLGKIVELDPYGVFAEFRASDGLLMRYKFIVDPTYKSPSADIASLELGYALTVHKAQGSTINNVVYYLENQTGATRQLLYTAFTRAKNQLFVASSDVIKSNSLDAAVSHSAYFRCNSYLATALTHTN